MAKSPKFCGNCGRKMRGPYCSKDGWAGDGSNDGGQASAGSNRTVSHGDVYGQTASTTGDNSPLFIGANSEITPNTKRVRERKLFRLLWIRVVGGLALLGSIASITGLNVGDLKFTGLFSFYKSIFTNMTTPGQVSLDAPLRWVLPLTSFFLFLMAAVACMVFLAQLRVRKYASLGSRYYENRGGVLTRTALEGTCPRCRGQLRLARVVVGTKTEKVKNSDGTEREKEREVKEVRLICNTNPTDHRFKFDPTAIRG